MKYTTIRYQSFLGSREEDILSILPCIDITPSIEGHMRKLVKIDRAASKKTLNLKITRFVYMYIAQGYGQIIPGDIFDSN